MTASRPPFPDILRPLRRARGSSPYENEDPSGRSVLERYLQLWQAAERLAGAESEERPDGILESALTNKESAGDDLRTGIERFGACLTAFDRISPTRLAVLCDPTHPRLSIAEQRHQLLRDARQVRASRGVPLDPRAASAAVRLLRAFRNAATHATAVTTDAELTDPLVGACYLLDAAVFRAYASAFEFSPDEVTQGLEAAADA